MKCFTQLASLLGILGIVGGAFSCSAEPASGGSLALDASPPAPDASTDSGSRFDGASETGTVREDSDGSQATDPLCGFEPPEPAFCPGGAYEPVFDSAGCPTRWQCLVDGCSEVNIPLSTRCLEGTVKVDLDPEGKCIEGYLCGVCPNIGIPDESVCAPGHMELILDESGACPIGYVCRSDDGTCIQPPQPDVEAMCPGGKITAVVEGDCLAGYVCAPKCVHSMPPDPEFCPLGLVVKIFDIVGHCTVALDCFCALEEPVGP